MRISVFLCMCFSSCRQSLRRVVASKSSPSASSSSINWSVSSWPTGRFGARGCANCGSSSAGCEYRPQGHGAQGSLNMGVHGVDMLVQCGWHGVPSREEVRWGQSPPSSPRLEQKRKQRAAAQRVHQNWSCNIWYARQQPHRPRASASLFYQTTRYRPLQNRK